MPLSNTTHAIASFASANEMSFVPCKPLPALIVMVLSPDDEEAFLMPITYLSPPFAITKYAPCNALIATKSVVSVSFVNVLKLVNLIGLISTAAIVCYLFPFFQHGLLISNLNVEDFFWSCYHSIKYDITFDSV